MLAPSHARAIYGQPLICVGQSHTKEHADHLTVWVSPGHSTALCHDAVLFTSIEAASEPLQSAITLQGNQVGIHLPHGIWDLHMTTMGHCQKTRGSTKGLQKHMPETWGADTWLQDSTWALHWKFTASPLGLSGLLSCLVEQSLDPCYFLFLN